MYHEICTALLPPNDLRKTLKGWAEIATRLSDTKRTRARQSLAEMRITDPQ